MYLTLAQAAEKLDRTERQVRYLIKNGILVPANQDTYKRDGGYRFSLEEVSKAEQVIKPEGISLRKAAQIVGITPQYLNSLALNGQVDSVLVLIGNKSERRFKKEDCLELRNTLQRKTHKSVAQYGEKLHLFKNNLRLFELIKYKDNNARIVKTEPITLLNSDGTLLTSFSGDTPIYNSNEWKTRPYKSQKGTIVFKIPIPRFPEHPTYEALYHLIESLGPLNVQVFEQSEGDYYIRCRQGKINIQDDLIQLLEKYLVEGEIENNKKGIFLRTSLVSHYVHLPKELHTEINRLAKERNVPYQQQLLDVIKNGVKTFQLDK